MGLGPGYAVSKHVRLVRLLGRGGMGSVWIADHLGLKTQVAVKFVSDVHASDPATRLRFQREATSAAQIGSPHIVNIHDHGVTSDGLPYMVMELLDGEDLSSCIKREGPLPLDHVARIVSQTCKALGKAHRLGIVHRDIKPSNIFLLDTEGDDIFVKVLDFGIAKPGGGESSDVTSTGMIVGTILYASPEQLLNAKSVDFRADLWSLGVVAYRAMAGKLPFSDENGIGALFLAMQAGTFVPPSQLVSTIPPEVDAWCKRALAHDRAARFDSAREMADALYTALGRTSSPSLTRAPRTGARASSRHVSRGESTGVESVVGEIGQRDEKATVAEPSYRSFSDDEASQDSALHSAASSAQRGKEASSRDAAKDPSSLGGAASAMTYVGEAGTHVSGAPGSGRRWPMIAAMVVALLGAGAVGFVYLKPPTKRLGGPSTPVVENEPGATAAPPASPTAQDAKAPPVVEPASSRVDLAPSPPAPSESASGASAPSASAPGARPKPSTRPGGPERSNPLPEKDYGF